MVEHTLSKSDDAIRQHGLFNEVAITESLGTYTLQTIAESNTGHYIIVTKSIFPDSLTGIWNHQGCITFVVVVESVFADSLYLR